MTQFEPFRETAHSSRSGGPGQASAAFWFMGLVVLAYIAAYWLWLWQGTVAWTTNRKSATVGVSIVAAFVGSIVGLIGGGAVEDDFGVFLGTWVTALAWLILTVLVWRENHSQRIARLRSFGRNAIVCLNCGYNLTGLKHTLCPECGAQPTVDELQAGQSARAEEELTGRLTIRSDHTGGPAATLPCCDMIAACRS